MKIKTFPYGLFDSNGYVVWNEDGGRGIVIDCGNAVSSVKEFVSQNGITVDFIMLTHGHYDHIDNVGEYQKAFPDAELIYHENEVAVTRDCTANLTLYFGEAQNYPLPDRALKNGDNVVIRGNSPENDIVFTVIDAPGHTPGSFLLLCESEKIMFTGDVIFRRGRGRTDFKGGDEMTMRKTLSMIAQMDGDIAFYSGHGEPSTVAAERNLYL